MTATEHDLFGQPVPIPGWYEPMDEAMTARTLKIMGHWGVAPLAQAYTLACIPLALGADDSSPDLDWHEDAPEFYARMELPPYSGLPELHSAYIAAMHECIPHPNYPGKLLATVVTFHCSLNHHLWDAGFTCTARLAPDLSVWSVTTTDLLEAL